MDDLGVYLPTDRRAALARGVILPDHGYGAAMFADVTGFTSLAEGLAQALGSRRGAEELTALLNQVYSALIAQIEQFGGCVIGFSGDAITCWFDDQRMGGGGWELGNEAPSPAALRALAAALAMQRAMADFAAVPTPSGGTAALMVKVTVVAGPVRRFLIGDPQIQVLEVLAGPTLDRLAAVAHLAERDDVVTDAATLAQVQARVPVAAWRVATYYSGDYVEAEQLVQEALRLSLACDDRHGAAVAKTILGQIAYLVGRYEDARRHSQESIAIEREQGNRWGIGFALISLGRVDQALGEYEEARRSFQEGLAIREQLGDARGIALCLDHLGDTEEALANYGAARRWYQESLARFQEIGHQAGAATALTKLGYNALATQEPKAARAYFQEALGIAWASQAIPRALDALVGIATLLAPSQPGQAGQLIMLVLSHTAATRESRDRAAVMLDQLRMLSPHEQGAEAQQSNDVESLEMRIKALLLDGGERTFMVGGASNQSPVTPQ